MPGEFPRVGDGDRPVPLADDVADVRLHRVDHSGFQTGVVSRRALVVAVAFGLFAPDGSVHVERRNVLAEGVVFPERSWRPGCDCPSGLDLVQWCRGFPALLRFHAPCFGTVPNSVFVLSHWPFLRVLSSTPVSPTGL